jgi:hypothetical protein
MKRYNILKREALASCKARDHVMTKFELDSQIGSRMWATSRCKFCDMRVSINTHPMPNEIEIGGEAVALDCSVRCPVCRKTIANKRDKEGQVTCPECQSYFPSKWAVKLQKYEDAIEKETKQ